MHTNKDNEWMKEEQNMLKHTLGLTAVSAAVLLSACNDSGNETGGGDSTDGSIDVVATIAQIEAPQFEQSLLQRQLIQQMDQLTL